MELIDVPKSAVAQYQPFYAQLVELETNNKALAFDYESKKGNKEARSHVFALRQTKGALEKTRKEAKAESLRIGRAVDSEAAEIEKRIEAMIVVHQVKLDEIEQREKDRLAALNLRLHEIVGYGAQSKSQDELRATIANLESLPIGDDFAELTADAAKAKDARLIVLRATLAARITADDEAAELARLRAEAEARAQKDRDDAIAKAAAERATAEAAAKAEQEAAKQRQAIAEAEQRATQEREAAARRELELKLQAEQAERRRIEQEQKAEQDRKDALAQAAMDAHRAVEAEKARVAAADKAEADAQAKREANKTHKAKINRTALAALVEGGISEECAKACITLIASGKVPAVLIEY